MDPLSITSSVIATAQLAKKVQVLFNTDDKILEARLPQFQDVLDIVTWLQHILDFVVQYIMQDDQTMISSQALAAIQPVLMSLAEPLQDLYHYTRKVFQIPESRRTHRAVMWNMYVTRISNAKDALRVRLEILKSLDSVLIPTISSASVPEREEQNPRSDTLSPYIEERPVSAQPATETRLRSIQGNWHPDKRLSDVGNQHNTSMPDSELVTEDQLVEGYLKRLGGKQRRYFSKLLFESESTYYIRIRETHNQNVDNKTLLKEFDEILLNSARPGSILPQDPNHLAIILCEAPTKSSNIIPFRQDIFVNIMEKLAIPVGLYQALLTGTPKSVFYVAGEYYQRPGFVLRTPVSGTENWTLALSWNTRFIALRGIILGLQGSEKSRLAMHLGDTMAESAHPMNIPVILCEMLIESDSTGVKTHASNLYQVELRTKLHGYPQTESSARSSKLAETPEKDFEDMTRSLNVIISRLAFHEMRIHANAVFVEQITSHIHTEPPSSKAYDEMYPRLHSMSQNLRERLNHLQTEQRALLLEISCNQKIAQSQLQIVYNLIAQRDNKENLAMAELQTELARIQTTIANTTKDDSYAMRTIAVMSIAFLPGTFVSSFFSMDMFNWQAPKGASVLSFRFWIYWAITAPLTLVVVLIWFFWLRAHKKREVNGRKDSTPTNTPLFRLARLARLTEPTSDDSKKQSWFQRRWERTLPKDEEKQTIQAIQSMHSSFAVIPVESTLRSRAPAAQIQRSETVLQGPVR